MKKIFKSLIVPMVLLSSCLYGCDKNDYSDYNNMSYRYAKGTNGAVTCANNLVSKIGLDTLKKGGNAFDAATAMSFALGVLEPNASGIGGGGVMTGYDAKNDTYVFYNFREFAPKDISYSLYTSEDQLSHGGLASGIPMEVSGILDIFDDLGSKNLTLQEIMQPSIDYCDNGYTVTSRLNTNISMMSEHMLDYASDEAKSLYLQEEDGMFLWSKDIGETIVNTNLGKVLKAIAEHGKDGFYSGWVANAIVASNVAEGGVFTLDDLARAKTAVVKSTPLHSTFNGYDIYTSKNPAAGGIIVAEVLNMIEHYCEANNKTLAEIGYGSEEFVHLYATASQLAYADRRYYVGDSSINPATNASFISVPEDGLISKDYAEDRFDACYNPNAAFLADMEHDFGAATGCDPWDYDTVNTNKQTYLYGNDVIDDGTTSFSVVDKQGNVCTITKTINTYFGSYVMPTGTGFFLNNQMADFSYNQLSVNRIEPNKRPISSMAPTIIAKDGEIFMTVGCPGSATIPNAVLQVILNVLGFNMDIQEAIEAPRIECMQSESSETSSKLICLEEKYNDVSESLSSKNYNVNEVEAVTHVYGITITKDKKGKAQFMAGADNRKDGKSLAY